MDESFEELIAIVELLKEAEFTQFRYSNGDLLIEISRGEPLPAPQISRGEPVPAPQTSPTPATPLVGVGEHKAPPATVDNADTVAVESPMLGTFYRCPKPGEPPFVQVGDSVAADTVVGIVEVMKLMNSVTAGVAGTVLAIEAGDGELVEPGTTLVRIQPAG